jgi:hypothetical protein
MEQEEVKVPCSICGSDDYSWAAVPEDESGAPIACSECHDLDENNDIHPKKSIEAGTAETSDELPKILH